MRLKLLLLGTQQSIIDDFFKRTDLDMECLTSSMRIEDIENHLSVFQPHFLVMCLKSENAETLKMMHTVRFACDKNHVSIAIFGKKEDCDFFKSTQVGVADVTLVAPMSLMAVVDNLEQFHARIHEEAVKSGKAAPEPLNEGITPDFIDSVIAGISTASSGAIGGGGTMVKKHILVVDDDPNMLKMIKMHLENRYEVATAISGSLALRFLAAKTTDLVLLDYEMPGEDGAEVLAKIRRIESLKDTPVVFLTGVTDTSKIRKALANKPDGYLLKPIDKDKLLATIAEKIG